MNFLSALLVTICNMRTLRRTIIKIIGNFFEETSTSLLCKFLNLSLLFGMLSGNLYYFGLTFENQQRQILKIIISKSWMVPQKLTQSIGMKVRNLGNTR